MIIKLVIFILIIFSPVIILGTLMLEFLLLLTDMYRYIKKYLYH